MTSTLDQALFLSARRFFDILTGGSYPLGKRVVARDCLVRLLEGDPDKAIYNGLRNSLTAEPFPEGLDLVTVPEIENADLQTILRELGEMCR